MVTIEKAGLSREHLNLAYFSDEEELRAILEGLGISENKEGHLVDAQDDIHCVSCEKPVTVEDVGHILPGSTFIYCRDPTCVLDYYERFF